MYSKYFISFVLIILVFTVLKLLFKGGNSNANGLPGVIPHKGVLFSTIIILFIALFPADYGSDKERYLAMFVNSDTINLSYDLGWTYYIKLFKFFSSSATLFFLATSLLYFSGNYLFIKSIVHKKYVFYFLIVSFGSLGYFAYGVNTIRAGIGLSFLLLAIVYRKNWRFIVFVVLAVMIHKSMVIPLAAFLIAKYYSKTKNLLIFWFVFLLLSIANVSSVSDFLKVIFADSDNRIEGYIGVESSELYNAGFRIDFLIYSILPLLVGYYYIFKLKFKDDFYIRLFNMYIIVNSFWLLLIRIPFTDRFAYLSWFLIPIVVMYPLFYISFVKNRHIKVAMAMGAIVFINFILHFI